MNTRDDNLASLPTDTDNTTIPDEKPFFTKSYCPEKIYEPTDEKNKENKKRWAENAKHIIIRGPMYFDRESQMWFYKQNNGNLMGDGTIDGKAPDEREALDDNHENRYLCRIV